MEQEWSGHMNPPAEDHYLTELKKETKNYLKTLESIQKRKPEEFNLGKKKTTKKHNC